MQARSWAAESEGRRNKRFVTVACLEANHMVREDLVKLTIYLTDSRFIGDYRAARSAVIGDEIQPASTLVIVSGLAAPDLLVEIEAWAAKSHG